MDSVTINLEYNNRIALLIGSVTLELVVKGTNHLTSETQAGQSDAVPLSLRDTRKVQIYRVLDICKGNIRQAAQVLGIGRTSLYRFLKCNPRMAVAEHVDTAQLAQGVS